MIVKFDKWDRKRVVDLIQETFGVTLSAVGSRDIWLRDESGAEWWILGGKDDFHGIPEEMMERESGEEITGKLVFTQKLVDSLNVYVGSLQPLIEAKHSLFRRSRDNAYLFEMDVRRDGVRIVQTPSVVLKKIGTILHTDSDRESAQNVKKATKMFESLSSKRASRASEEIKQQGEGWIDSSDICVNCGTDFCWYWRRCPSWVQFSCLLTVRDCWQRFNSRWSQVCNSLQEGVESLGQRNVHGDYGATLTALARIGKRGRQSSDRR